MSNQNDAFKNVVSHCKEYGFVYPSSELYDGLSAVYDYGPLGVELKNNIKKYWWKAMVQLNENIVGLDSAIFMHPKIWKASGHVDAFNDPMIDNKDSKKRYRADVLIEEYIAKIEKKIDKEVNKAKKRFGDDFVEEKFKQEHPRVKKYYEDIASIMDRMSSALQESRLEDVKALIEELGIACPVSGSKNWTDVRQFNLMFSTQLGSISGEEAKLYLRPETAQGIFVNYLNIQKTSRQKIPFGIAQIGKAFRNEIVARQFIFRMREFEQMEMQFFVKPGTEMQWYEQWKEKRMKWHLSLGIHPDLYRWHDHENLAHYANAATDIEFNFPFGFKELEGIHSRTDFDLSRHEEFSGRNIKYFDPETEENYTPYVVETSIGVDRMFLAILSQALVVEELENDGKKSERTVLKLPAVLAPYQCAVLPLVKNKEALSAKAREIYSKLSLHYNCQYDEKDAIGRRYRRQDAIGTPICITVDFESLEDGAVTVRDRDELSQERVKIEDLVAVISKRVNMSEALEVLI